MANTRYGVVLGVIAVSLLLFMQLIAFKQPPNEGPSSSFDPKFSSWRDRAGAATDSSLFLLGAGKADVTGPVVEVGFNGYASLDQKGTGLRQRLYSRAFIMANPGNPEDTFIYLVLDTQSGDTAIRNGVLKGLASLGGDYTRYGEHNVALTGTHSHSGPGAWMNYLLPQLPNLGFDKRSYQAIVDGTILSIKRAHESLTPGRLSFGSIDLENANINRSPFSYDHNPEEEKAKYSANVDKTLTLLRFDRESDNKTAAVLTWFPVHGTSLYNNNTLVTGDNKGVAAYLFERSIVGDSRFAQDAIIGFSQANVGDTSPNTEGAWCEDGSNVMCNYSDSTCGGSSGGTTPGTNEACHGRGPFFQEKDNGAKSCFEIGKRQYSAAKTLYDQMDATRTPIVGSSEVRSFHVYHDMNGYTFPSPFNGTTLKTCPAALGYSFAAGTTDGPGAFDFTQNASSPATENPLWKVARAFIHQPSEEQKECQGAKDVLLDVGTLTEPYAWAPDIVDIQVLRVGQLFIIVSTSEATTMSGRRWKAAIAQGAQKSLSVSDPLVVLGAPSNSYAHYVATEEEYSVQRYEGASTLYGPSTLAAYINLTLTYLPYLGSTSDIAKLATIPAGPSPRFITGVIYDNAPIGKSFGDVLSNPDKRTYGPGDTVKTTFVGANPRNNFHQESTYAAVQRKTDSGSWEVVRNDRDWNLVFLWKRTNGVLGYSEVTLQWQIEDSYYSVGNPTPLESGTYRMHYYGDSKNVLGKINSFEGIGGTFTVKV
ncbi:Neutral ceramidase 2 [Penicillium diatomitis]|uniref:Neutral ceramidase n=1 Tax=Penicillium diatomitis TaxID=2819901 RepID=A0A9W9WV75_9EURO|nr:Neutral ceramidase 2 [Penicillium diatomitis]KAJ5477122.1 Neutral ceramidase 2 [Penicillium diatomitis]